MHFKLIMALVEDSETHAAHDAGATGHFEDRADSGIAFQIDIEDAVGVSHQIRELTDKARDCSDSAYSSASHKVMKSCDEP